MKSQSHSQICRNDITGNRYDQKGLDNNSARNSWQCLDDLRHNHQLILCLLRLNFFSVHLYLYCNEDEADIPLESKFRHPT